MANPAMSVTIRLCIMMFLNYVIWGAWYVTIGTWLTATLHFSGTQAGAVFGTAALSCMVSPLFVGLLADRYLATERVLALLHLMGAAVLFLVSRATSFTAVYSLMLLYCLCFFPTIPLTNSLTLRNISDAGRQFPLIRVFATIGWIVIGIVIGRLAVEASSTPFLIAAGASLVMSAFSLMLPHTPPVRTKADATWRTMLGLDAIAMMKERSYLVFVIASVLACIPLTFYFSFTNAYLNDIGVANAAGKMSLGQASEVVMMLLMPFIYRRMGVKAILLLGLAAWGLRYMLLAYGAPGDRMWMLYAAILLHGVCFDFFFMTGQIYTDQQAPAHLRGTAQGFLTFLTYGLGMFIGSLLSGIAVDFFSTTVNGQVHHNWTGFWLSSGLGALCIAVLVAALFRGGAIRSQRAAASAA